MTIGEFIDMCYNDGLLIVKIYDGEEVVFNDYGDNVPEHYRHMEFDTFDVPTELYTITFNI
jgi:hypothetical protein